MRNGTYPLEIELGSYRGIAAENRLCKLCRCEPETEEHFLLKCAKTNDIRQKMVSDINGMLLQNGIVFYTLSLADKLKTSQDVVNEQYVSYIQIIYIVYSGDTLINKLLIHSFIHSFIHAWV